MDASQLEHRAVEAVARLAPWLAPLPSAYFVARASMRHLDAPLAIAVIIGAAIETLGITASATALSLYEWNVNSLTPAGNLRRGRRLAPRLTLWLAGGAGALYLAVVIGLTVLLEVWPALSTYALAAFPLFALVGTLLLGIRVNAQKREVDAMETRRRQNDRREIDRLTREIDQMTNKIDTVKASVEMSDNGRDDESVSDTEPYWRTLDEFLSDAARHPDITPVELAERSGRSVRQARRWLKAASNSKPKVIE